MVDPLPQRPPNGESSDQPNLEVTVAGDDADRTTMEEEEEMDQAAREQYDPVCAPVCLSVTPNPYSGYLL